MAKGLKRELKRERRLRRMKRLAAEMTPAEKFAKMLALKKATRCILNVEDEYNVYVKLAKTFKELGEASIEEPFEGCEQCEELSKECAAKAEELKARLPKEKKKESRTVMTSAKERELQEKKNKKNGNGKWVWLGIAIVAVALIVCYNTTSTRYYIAKAQHAVGLSKYAMESYEVLGNYKDSFAQKAEMEKILISQAQEGDEVLFGTRKWMILEKKEDAAVLLANKSLETKPYHNEKSAVTWETCSLRQYLNQDFVQKNFTEAEQAALLEMDAEAEANEQYKTKAGNATADKVNIMSVKEAEQYKEVLGDKSANMRLRTPGEELDSTCYMSCLKEVIYEGFPVEKKGALVRPVITVKIK